MFTNYCQKCGFRNQNPTSKPKFCQNCGESFSFSTTQAKSSIDPPQRQVSQASDNEEDGYIENIPSNQSWREMTDFPVDIVLPQTTKTTIGSIAGTSKDPVKPIPSVKLSKGHRQKAMKLFREEAGTLRPKK